jgi:hypothetical protein
VPCSRDFGATYVVRSLRDWVHHNRRGEPGSTFEGLDFVDQRIIVSTFVRTWEMSGLVHDMNLKVCLADH